MISNIITELVASYGIPADWINGGRCHDFAQDLLKRFPNGQIHSNNFEDGYCYHVSFLLDGRYYDSECPEGVEDWRHLPCMRRYKAST